MAPQKTPWLSVWILTFLTVVCIVLARLGTWRNEEDEPSPGFDFNED